MCARTIESKVHMYFYPHTFYSQRESGFVLDCCVHFRPCNFFSGCSTRKPRMSNLSKRFGKRLECPRRCSPLSWKQWRRRKQQHLLCACTFQNCDVSGSDVEEENIVILFARVSFYVFTNFWRVSWTWAKIYVSRLPSSVPEKSHLNKFISTEHYEINLQFVML